MVNHNNPNITRRYNQLFNLKGESASTELYDDIMSVIVINPICDVVEGIGSGASGNLPVYTTPTNKDFYLTGFIFQAYSNVTCDNTFQTLTCVINGATKYLVYRLKGSLTAEEINIVRNFTVPIKIDRGTQIIGGNSFTAGASGLSLNITGYTDPDN